MTDRQPPDDPELWTDEEWLDFLAATDPAPPATADPDEGARERGIAGSLLAAAMRGVADALGGVRKQDQEIHAEAPGGPGPDDPLELHLDPDSPARSRAILRRLRRPH